MGICVKTARHHGVSSGGAARRLTVVSKQGLGGALGVRAGGLRAAPAGETNAAVGPAVTLTPGGGVAPVYAPLHDTERNTAALMSSASRCFRPCGVLVAHK